MITTKLYLDTRSVKSDGTSPIKITINKRGKTALLPLNLSVLPTSWDKVKEQITNHPNKIFLNNFIKRRKLDVETEILKLVTSGRAKDMSVTEIKNHVADVINGTPMTDDVRFLDYFISFAQSHQPTTCGVYMHTVSRMRAYDSNIENRTFDDINKAWLQNFDKYLAKTAPSANARNIHFRNIRATFNDAIDNDVTTFYPFRKFKLKYEETAKRSITIEQLRTLKDCHVEKHQERYRDLFLLMFYLIGINIKDLFYLSEITSDGYIEYKRFKTKKMYRIKVEPEAMEIINKYRGEKYLLNIADTYSDHRYFIKRINIELKRIVKAHNICDTLSTYWCRHTWASIASSLDIPIETISAALGHSNTSVTHIYIKFDNRKIDIANRKVLDFIKVM